MLQSCPLLNLPSEIRDTIYFYVFNESQPIHLRSPTCRRLRPAHVERKDPRDLLETCQRIRYEAIPIFYHINSLVFRKSCEALEFLSDAKIHPAVRHSVTRIAVDDGDINDHGVLRDAQFQLASHCVRSLPNFAFLEFRTYARTDNTPLSINLTNLFTDWKRLDELTNLGQTTTKLFDNVYVEQATPLAHALLGAKMHVKVQRSVAKYDVGGKTELVSLSCCNVVIDKDGKTPSTLGCAKAATKKRMKKVGVQPGEIAAMDRDHWCDARDPLEESFQHSCSRFVPGDVIMQD